LYINQLPLACDLFAFAVGGHDGSIRIWSTFSCLTPMTLSPDPQDTTPTESLSSHSPRGWHTDRIPADNFLKVITPTRRLRSLSMTSTAFPSKVEFRICLWDTKKYKSEIRYLIMIYWKGDTRHSMIQKTDRAAKKRQDARTQRNVVDNKPAIMSAYTMATCQDASPPKQNIIDVRLHCPTLRSC
jgi:WD40 repeat protein